MAGGMPVWPDARRCEANVAAPTLATVIRLPRAARLTCWFTSWAYGRCSLDDARDGAVADDAAHDVLGLDDQPVPLVLALGQLRRRGAERATLALPVPGDLVGLGGPPTFNTSALDAGEAVVLPGAGLGLVPSVVGAGVTWRASAADDGAVADLGTAEVHLRDTLRETTTRLVDLDVARWRPEAATELLGLRRSHGEPLAPGHPARAQRLAALALRCRAIVDLAQGDEGGSVSSYEVGQRLDALRQLERSARHALVAACSADPTAAG